MTASEADRHNANMVAFWGAYALAPGGTVMKAGADRGFATGVPVNLFNPVILGRLQNAALLYDQVATELARRGGGAYWWVGRRAQGRDARAHLFALGLEEANPTPAMRCPLEGFRPGPTPEGLRVVEATSPQARREWARAMSGWFGFPPDVAEAVALHETAIPEAALVGQRRYLGFFGDVAVAASSLVMAAGLAGVHAVATDPAYRRRGLGRAMTAHAMAAGQARGAGVAVLQSSTMGLPVYRDLGFTVDFDYLGFRQKTPASAG